MPSVPAMYVAPLGRILLSLLFLLSGLNKLTNWNATAEALANEGVVAVDLMLTVATALELLGGLSVLLGFVPRLGAFMLVMFLVPVTFIMHDFWAYDGDARQEQMVHFFKNLAILGGVLMVLAFGAGPLSIDYWRRSGGRWGPT